MHVPTRRAPRADLPAERGGETSPPGCARSARRPPHCVGRRNLPTWLRALRAPTSPLRGEAKPPHPARSARRPPHCVGRRHLPTRRRALRAPTSPLRGEATPPHPACSLREQADLPVEIG